MKKILLIFIVCMLVLTFFVYELIQSFGEGNPAKLLPADTIVYACTPNLLQTAIRWPGTSLAKISQEPDVKEFLNKPLSFSNSSPGKSSVGSKVFGMKPIRIFFAAPKISSDGEGLVVGIQFFGRSKNAEEALDFLRDKIARGALVSAKNSFRYNGNSIRSTVYKKAALYSAIRGHWALLSNDLATLQSVLDRMTRKDRTPSLAQNVDYIQINKHLPRRPDLQIFLNSKLALNALLSIGNSLGEVPDPAQVQKLREVGSIGITSKIDGAAFRDTMALLLVDPPNFPPLQHIAMKFTQPTTLGYLETFRQGWGFFGISLFVDKLLQSLTQTQISADTFNQMFGSEAAAFFSWPTTNFRPPTVFVSEVRDQKVVADWLNHIGFQSLPSNSQVPNTAFYQGASNQSSLIAPTIAFHENLLFAGLTMADITNTLSSDRTTITLENSSVFAPALSRYRANNVSFCFLNTKQLFERIYALVRPIITFSALLSPNLMQFIDASKLPPAESISKHLKPIVSTQQLQGHVMVFDSSGPITIDQALLLFFLAKTGMSSTCPPYGTVN